MFRKTRINTRTTNLASVGISQQENDETLFCGMAATGRYYTREDRKEVKVLVTDGRWVYEQSRLAVSSQSYMYAVGPNGALFIGKPMVHSQFKAGNDVQSAGHIQYDENNPKKIRIDNNSGHYSPTISQFLSTIYGLIRADVLPNKFEIGLNKLTKFDYTQIDSAFWNKAKEDGAHNKKQDVSLRVSYNKSTDSLLFTREDGQTCQLQGEQLLENGKFVNMVMPNTSAQDKDLALKNGGYNY